MSPGILPTLDRQCSAAQPEIHLCIGGVSGWVLGHNPSARIICASYGQDLAAKHALDCRIVMEDPFYRKFFLVPALLRRSRPRRTLEPLPWAEGWQPQSGGVLTGRGADYLIIDDPLKPDEAISDVRRTAANDWFDHTLLSRLDNKARA